ncbi:MAG: hypothetical protein ABFD92_03250 [Planctomycetaceae bacterium]
MNEAAEDLQVHKIYCVLYDKQSLEQGFLRVIDDSGEDYLYPSSWFTPIDPPAKVKDSLLLHAK